MAGNPSYGFYAQTETVGGRGERILTTLNYSVIMKFSIPVDPMSVQFAGKRVMVRGGKPIFFKQQRVVKWEQSIEWLTASYRPATPLEGALEMSVWFVMKRPKAMFGKKHPDERVWNIHRPDADNLQKGLQDALKGFWIDDAQIVKLSLNKCYAAKDETPKIEVEINKL